MRIPAHIMAGRCLSTSRRLFSPSLPCKLSPAGPSFKPPYRSFHFSTSSSSSSPFNPFAVDTLDISRVQNTTLKEISENFARISIVEPPKTVSIVEPLESVIKISPDVTVKKILDPSAREELRADSVLKKRRRKMNKHKLKRVRKQQRFLMRKLGK